MEEHKGRSASRTDEQGATLLAPFEERRQRWPLDRVLCKKIDVIGREFVRLDEAHRLHGITLLRSVVRMAAEHGDTSN
jgi:hypothetical protein